MQVSEIVKGILKYLESVGKPELAAEVGRQLIKQSKLEEQRTVVETAIELTEVEKKQIEKQLGPAEFRLNEKLLGGMKVIQGDKQIDLSVRKRLEDIYAA